VPPEHEGALPQGPSQPPGPPPPTGLFANARALLGPWVELIVVVALAFGAAYAIQWLIVKPYRIPSESMENTLLVGDRVLVARFWYRFESVKRGDIVVFHPPKDLSRHATTPDSETFIKRAIGLPGDWVGTTKGHVYICSAKPALRADPLATSGCRILTEPYTLGVSRNCGGSRDYGPVFVTPGHYLMLGDNREDSTDGRCFGLIPKSWILGRAFARIWPLQRVGLL
jgi:signal peptidase I